MFVERELHASEWVRALLSTKNPLIVDVGANAGVFSHYVHCLKHDSSFIAFEPLPKMVQRLNELKNRTSMNMEIHQKAVSDECGEAWFETAHGYDGTSKLASDKESTGNRIRVDTTTLDAVLASRHILLMKIDVEGFECNVIKGGLKCLSQTDYVIMESESADHLTKVSAALGNNWASRKVGATDYLFFKKAAH
jgi:FkbM family methyltransferase